MKRNRSNQTPLSLFSFQDIITSVTGVVMLLTLLLALELTTRTVASTSSTASYAVAEKVRESIAAAEQQLAERRAKLAALNSQEADIGEFTQRSADAEVSAVLEEISILQEKIAALRKQIEGVGDSASAKQNEFANRTADVEQLERLKEKKLAVEEELTELKNSQRVFYTDADQSGRQVVLVELFADDILVAEAGQDQPPHRFSGENRKRSFLDWATDHSSSRIRFVLIVHPGTTELFQDLRGDLRDKGYSTGFDLLPSEKVAIDIEHGAG